MDRLQDWVRRIASLSAIVLLVFIVHEFGHFAMAKLFDVRVLRFEIGKGPSLVSIPIGETEFSLAPVPLGAETVVFVDRLDASQFTEVELLGFVLSRSAVEEMRKKNPELAFQLENFGRSFIRKSLEERLIIVAAGPVFNLLFAIIVTTVACFLPSDKSASGGRLRPFTTEDPDDALIDAISLPLHLIRRKAKVEELSGPVGVVTEVWRLCGGSWRSFLIALSSTSIAMGYFNLLPIPTLDGGWVAMMFWDEWIFPLNLTTQYQVIAYGSWCLMGLLLLLTWHDLYGRKSR